MKAARRLAALAAFFPLILCADAGAQPDADWTKRFYPFGSVGVLGRGAEDLVFPARHERFLLLRTRDDLLFTWNAGTGMRSVLEGTGIIPVGLVTDPAYSHRWYVLAGSYPGSPWVERIWQTVNSGKTWTPMNLPAAASYPGDYRELRLFVDQFDSEKLALEVWSSLLGIYTRFVSTDRGGAWSEVPVVLDTTESQLLGINDGSVYFKTQRYELASGQTTPIGLSHARKAVFHFFKRNILYVERSLGPAYAIQRSSDRGQTLVAQRSSPHPSRFFIQAPWTGDLAIGDEAGLSLSFDKGAHWTTEVWPGLQNAAFEPVPEGDLLVAGQHFERRKRDGQREQTLAAQYESVIREVAVSGRRAVAVSFFDDVHFHDEGSYWQNRGPLKGEGRNGFWKCVGAVDLALSPTDPGLVLAICQDVALITRDAGRTWKLAAEFSLDSHFPFQVGVAGNSLYVLTGRSQIYRSGDFGGSWELLPTMGFGGIAAHPDRGLLAVRYDGSLVRHLPASGWTPSSATLPGNGEITRFAPFIAGDAERHPGLLYGIRGSLLSRSLDFGDSWEEVADLATAAASLPGGWLNENWPYLQLIIDPFDRDHFILLGLGLETRDGGRSFSTLPLAIRGTAAFDPLTRGRLLAANLELEGVFERREESLEAFRPAPIPARSRGTNRFYPIGPSGTFGDGAEDLVFSGSESRHLLLRNRRDLLHDQRLGFGPWKPVLEELGIRPAGLVTDPADPCRWYVLDSSHHGSGLPDRVWQTGDSGKSWSELNLPPAAGFADDFRELSFFVDRFDGFRLALEIWSTHLGIFTRWTSADRGVHWSEIPEVVDTTQYQMLGINAGFVYYPSKRFHIASGRVEPTNLASAARVVFDRADADTLYVERNSGSARTWSRSKDGGKTLSPMRPAASAETFFTQSAWDPRHLAIGEETGFALTQDGGATWTFHQSANIRNAVFDPHQGHLLVAGDRIERLRPDGSWREPPPSETAMRDVAIRGSRGAAVSRQNYAFFSDQYGRWRDRGPIWAWPDGYLRICSGQVKMLLSPYDPLEAVAICQSGAFLTRDAGRTWEAPPSFSDLTFPLQVSTAGDTVYVLALKSQIYRSADFGATWEALPGSGYTGIAAHPDRGLLAVQEDGSLFRHLPGAGWTPEAAQLPGQGGASRFPPFLAGDPEHPGLVYAIRGVVLSRSRDFGASWEPMGDLSAAVAGAYLTDELPYLQLVIDPFDRDHFLMPGLGLESRDGGRTIEYVHQMAQTTASFDPLTRGRVVVAERNGEGLLDRSEGERRPKDHSPFPLD